VVRFSPKPTEERAIAGPRAFNGVDDESPLTLPRRVKYFAQSIVPATAVLAWVVFDILLGATLRGGEIFLLEAAHSSEACLGVQDEKGPAYASRRARGRLLVLTMFQEAARIIDGSGVALQWPGGSRRAMKPFPRSF